jgi:4-hydroxymandelate oxidase
MPPNDGKLQQVKDYEAAARQKLPFRSAVSGFFSESADACGNTYSNNLSAFASCLLRPRVLVDVTERRLATTALGTEISIPVIIAPTGGNQRFHRAGELALARAAGEFGTIMALSTVSSYSIEDVAAAATGPLWFQLYVLKGRDLTEKLVRRADDAGYKALVVTVDNQSYREPTQRSIHSELQEGDMHGNFFGAGANKMGNYWKSDWFTKATDFCWSDLRWLRSITDMPIVIKGIKTVKDAQLCVDHGVDGFVISNHGGYGVAGMPGTLRILAEVTREVKSSLEVYLDGGIRRGTDVLKALALGARGVLIGRAALWGLAVDGEQGVAHVLSILANELHVAMGLCGVTDVRDVPRDLVSDGPPAIY